MLNVIEIAIRRGWTSVDQFVIIGGTNDVNHLSKHLRFHRFSVPNFHYSISKSKMSLERHSRDKDLISCSNDLIKVLTDLDLNCLHHMNELSC